MTLDASHRIPPQLLSFFREKVGEILVVKGPPGSGKTMFALELLKGLCSKSRGLAIFLRLDDDQLRTEIPWFTEANGSNIKPFHQNDKIADANWFKRELQNQMAAEGPPLGYMLFDPIDAITEQYENPERKIKEIVSLVQSTNVSAIMIQEEEGTTYLDHIAGGVVRIDFDTFDGRRYRSLEIEKLRGIEVGNARYLLSLHKGEFRAFIPWNPVDSTHEPWIALDDTNTHFSTGLLDLDEILGGGYKRGSYNILDVDDNVTYDEYMLVLRPILLNFLHHGFGVLMVPMAGEHPESIREDLEKHIEPNLIQDRLFFLDYFSTTAAKPYIIPMGATRKEGSQSRGLEVIQYLRGKDNKPYLDFVGLDTMEYLRGDTITLKHLITGVSKTKVTKTLGIGLAKPGLKIGQGIRNMSDVYLRMVKLNSIPCIYGVKPDTVIYALSPHPDYGYPNLEIIPLV